jgi:hypothetical protein
MAEDNEILGTTRDPQPVRKTQIIIETHTTTVIRTTGDALDTAFCITCGSHTADLSAANAAAILQVDQSELDLFRRTGELHTTERGGLCGKSLIDHSKREIVIPTS